MTLRKRILGGALMAAPAMVWAAEIAVEVEVPELTVAEYHRPYVAAWLENEQGQHLQNLAVWYDHDMRNSEGNKWLKDLRLWWRRSGRSLDMPVDGYTGATRAPGIHQLDLEGVQPTLEQLKPGRYTLVVEAAREVGGRETVRLSLDWPATEAVTLSARGNEELGTINVTVSP